MRMRKDRAVIFAISCLALFGLFASLPSVAQEGPRIQVFGGYSYLRYDSKPLGFTDSTAMNGGNAALRFNLLPQFGIVGELGAQYGSNLRVEDWMVGPEVTFHHWGVDLFGHALFGKGQTRVELLSDTVKSSGRATAFGGGVDFKLSDRLGIRLIQADYFTTNSFDKTENNLRISTGVLFRWGTVRTHRRQKLPSAP